MRKLFVPILLLALVAACGGTPAQNNMNRLAGVESAYGVAQSGALAYAKLPLRGTNTCPCSDGSVIATMQSSDKAAVSAITAAHDALKLDPAGAAVPALIDAATSATAGLQALVNAQQGSK